MALNAEQAASFELLAPERRLPASARNVRVAISGFQDTLMNVRFETSLADARTFAKAMTGQTPSRDGSLWRRETSLDWWPEVAPPGLESAEDTPAASRLPYIRVFIQPRGPMATVWLYTFTT